MITQTSINKLSFPITFSLPDARQELCPYDDEDKLDADMERSSLDITQDQPLPDIDPDDFEKLYHLFLS